MDLNNISDTIFLWYNEFIEWYLVQPIYGQILSIIGVIALLALTITLIYYMIKGLAYLIYYTLKGFYLLWKWIGMGVFKLCEGFYKMVSGEGKANKQIENSSVYIERRVIRSQNKTIFCTECGKKFSEKMVRRLLNGKVFCVNCGKVFTLNEFQISLTH